MANSRRGHGLSAAEQAAVETSVADGGVMEGYVRRKPHNPHKSLFRNSSNRWNNRYLVLHESTLHYYARKGYPDAKRSYALLPGCTVKGPTNNPSQGLWTFEISFPQEYTRSNSSTSSGLETGREAEGRGSCMLEGLDEAEEDDMEAPNSPQPSILASQPSMEDLRQQSSSSLDALNGSSDGKKPKSEKALRRAESRREKKVEKLERKFEKTKKKERMRVAEFGVISRKECEGWVMAVKSAIAAMQVPCPERDRAFDPVLDTPILRKSSMVLKSPSHGVIPGEFRKNSHGIELHAVKKKEKSDAAPPPADVAAPVSKMGSRSLSNLPEREGDALSPGLLQLPTRGPKYCVHSVEGNMVVYREIGERGLPTPKDRADCAAMYNEAVALGAFVGIVSSMVLYWLGLGSPFQFLFGLAFALITLYFRVDSHELRADEETHYMTTQIVRGSPSSIFDTIMNEDDRPYWDAATSSHSVIEVRDEHCDVVHLIQRPVWISSLYLWSKPRDLVLLRYWRRERDGSYFIFHQSTEHPDAPVTSEFVRGHVSSSCWIITPPTDLRGNTLGRLTCRVTYMIHYDAGGIAHWLNKLGGFDHVFSLPWLRTAVSLADALKTRDYETGGIEYDEGTEIMSPVTPAMAKVRTINTLRRRHSTADTIDLAQYEVNFEGVVTGIGCKTVSADPESFCEVDACLFNVRGPDYAIDRAKVPSAPSGFHLVAFDVYNFEDGNARFNLGSLEGSYAWRYRNVPEGHHGKFTYIINLIVPAKFGNMAVVVCFQPEDPEWRTSNSPCYKMFRKFIDGDDEFRKTRFKLIPRVVDGAWIIRKTVPNKPALVANKGLAVPFYKTDHYFEVDVDITSDSKANYITKLALGYSTSIVVDIAFLVEAQADDEVAESIDGVVRFNRINLTTHKYISAGSSLGYRQVVPRASTSTPNANEKPVSLARRRKQESPAHISLRHVSEEVS